MKSWSDLSVSAIEKVKKDIKWIKIFW
jgi:hypothetical protein